MPCDYSKYPANWKEIRASILERAQHRCELCGVANYAVGYRNWAGLFVPLSGVKAGDPIVDLRTRAFKIVLTVAHIDNDTTHNAPGNLLALCQKCHNGHDAHYRAANRKARKRLTTDPQ